MDEVGTVQENLEIMNRYVNAAIDEIPLDEFSKQIDPLLVSTFAKLQFTFTEQQY